MPKEMLPIVNKPLVHYGVDEAVEANLNYIGFVTGRGKRAIADYFDISYELEDQIAGTGKETLLQGIRYLINNVKFSFTRQNNMLGLGHAILSGETLIGQEAFAVVLADDLCLHPEGKGILAQMVTLYQRYHCSIIAVQEVDNTEIERYGVIAGIPLHDDLYKVTDMIEKPSPENAPSHLAIIGRYILTPDIFEIIKHTQPGKNGEVQLTDALRSQAQNACVMAYKFKGIRFDCGSIDGFIDATNYCYRHFYQQGEQC